MTRGRPPSGPGRPSEPRFRYRRAPVDTPEVIPAIRLPFVRAFAAGRFFAVLGMQVLNVAIGWHLYERTGSPFALGLVGLVEIVPVLALFIPVGHVVDRFPRRRIAALAHVLLAATALGLAACARWSAPLVWIYALLVLVGVARAFSAPSVGTILPQLLAPVQYQHANAWLAVTFELATIAGPAVGGLLIAATDGVETAFLVTACAQVVFLGFLSRVPAKPPPEKHAASSAKDLLAGLQFVRRNPVFLAAISLDLLAVLFGGALALLPVFAKDILDAGPTGLGWLRTAPALGALSMALVATRLPPWKRPGRVLLLTVTGFGLATVGFGLSTSLGLSLACLFLTGVFDSVSVVIRATLSQTLTPDPLRGRVAAVTFVFIGLSNELGAFESGVAAQFLGPVLAVVLGGVATVAVVGLVTWFWPELVRIGPLASLRPVEDAASEPEVRDVRS